MQPNDTIIDPIVPPVKRRERHMAVDTSSLSDAPEGVIGSIGFVVFEPKDTGMAVESYMKTIDWDQKGRSYNWPKVQEWMGSSTMARRCILNFSAPVPLAAAMSALTEAFKKNGCVALWGNKISLDQVEDAALYCKVAVPWGPGQVRDIAAACSTAGDLGNVISVEREPTEPDMVPLGNAAFVARAVRHIYQSKGVKPEKELTL